MKRILPRLAGRARVTSMGEPNRGVPRIHPPGIVNAEAEMSRLTTDQIAHPPDRAIRGG